MVRSLFSERYLPFSCCCSVSFLSSVLTTSSPPSTLSLFCIRIFSYNLFCFAFFHFFVHRRRRRRRRDGVIEFVLRNFVGVIQDISIDASTVETDLFPKGPLEYYTYVHMIVHMLLLYFLLRVANTVPFFLFVASLPGKCATVTQEEEYGVGIYTGRVR